MVMLSKGFCPFPHQSRLPMRNHLEVQNSASTYRERSSPNMSRQSHVKARPVSTRRGNQKSGLDLCDLLAYPGIESW